MTPKKLPVSRFVCQLIVDNKFTHDEIASKVEKKYPDSKFTGMRVVKYYINFIALGKMKKAGFPSSSLPTQRKKKIARRIK